jgi:hypothetical protein
MWCETVDVCISEWFEADIEPWRVGVMVAKNTSPLFGHQNNGLENSQRQRATATLHSWSLIAGRSSCSQRGLMVSLPFTLWEAVGSIVDLCNLFMYVTTNGWQATII